MLKKIIHILNTRRIYFLLLSACFFAVSFITQKAYDIQYLPRVVEHKLQKNINTSERDFYNLLSTKEFLLYCKKQDAGNLNLYQKPYGIFVYAMLPDNCLALKSWSNNQYHINEAEVNLTDSNYVVSYQNGVFEIIRRQIKIDENTFLVIATIPIKWDYFIKNKYLEPRFNGFDDLHKYYQVSNSNAVVTIHSINGKPLLGLKKIQPGFFFSYNLITIFFRFLGLVFLFIFINEECAALIDKIGFVKSFGILTTILVLLRTSAYFVSFPYNYNKLPLFDPSIYASNFVHRSLGDLWANLALVLWLLSFKKVNQKSPVLFPAYQHKKVAVVINTIAIVLLSLFFLNILQSLVIDSKISFDVSNFSNLNFYSLIAFIVISILFVVYYRLCSILLIPIRLQKVSVLKQTFIFLIVAISYLVTKKVFTDANILIPAIALVWVLFFILLSQKITPNWLNIAGDNIVLSFFWTVIFTVSASALIVTLSKTLEIEQRKKIAEKIYLQSDATVENLLNIATTGFTDNYFTKNFDKLNDPIKSEYIKDSLVAENFSGYLNKYETKIYLFNENGNGIYNNDSTTINKLNDAIDLAGKAIGKEGLYSVNSNTINEGYIYRKNILNAQQQAFYKLYIVIQSKKNEVKGIFPELFRQWQDADIEMSNPYAIYDSGHLAEYYGNYNFPLTLSKMSAEFTLSNEKENSVLTYQPTNSKSIVIVKQTRTLLDFITLFAYLFFCFLIVIFILLFAESVVYANFNIRMFFSSIKFNIRTQIRTTIIFISSFSFIVIGVVTVIFLINKFKQSTEEKLVKSISNTSIEIKNVLSKKDFANPKNIEVQLVKIAEQEGYDINLFSGNGILSSSTQPYIYNKKLVDININPIAYQKIYVEKNALYKQEESIGSLHFLSLYKPILDDKSNIICCVNISYLNSEVQLNQEISNFVITLMNLNAFIFLIAGAIAYVITNRITASFKLIGDKMRDINWQSNNEEITWTKNDEIGALVNEYNNMVRKLDETAKAFAQSQKEQAWREMAKQVAHEIKNPLTPMKLSIQYLQKSIDEDAPNVKELSKTVAKTLVEQIDQLTNIAGDFSQFANINNSKAELVNICDVLLSLVSLYSSENYVQIHHQLKKHIVNINADKNQIMRLFTNIIKNAVEASASKNIINIYIDKKVNNGNVLISIKDEGEGIPEEMHSKIFSVNFTTKSSGTGLGLAICKGIVESANGKIWFETSTSGTTFFVEFPLA